MEPTAHLAAAAYLMKHLGDTALVVTTDDSSRPIALITDADISHAVADRRELEGTRISDLALPPPVTVESGTSALEAARLMMSRRIHHLPVVDDGSLVGLVEFLDVCRPVLEKESSPPSAASDGAPRSRDPQA